VTPVVRLEREGPVAVIVIDNPPVNASSHPVRRGLLEAAGQVSGDEQLVAAVIIGSGRTFVAGADIREFDQPWADPQMPEVIAAIVASSKPFVAALHGSALGGGFELALACDVRIAAPGTQVGLPEVTLGMIPGAGGTQHLPRLVGIARAIEIVASGRRIPAEEALALGLIDHLVAGDLRQSGVEHAVACLGCKRRLHELPVPHEPQERIEAAANAALAAGNHSVPVREAIAAVQAAATTPYPEALAREREVFQRLRNSDEAAALRRQFFAARGSARGKPPV
jgi:3-hydroxyacyl-CoA dehydrogenase